MYLIKKDDSGVFSNFMRAVDWFWYSLYSGERICLDWNYEGVNLLEGIFENCHQCNSYKFTTSNFVEKSGLILADSIEKRRDSISFYRKYNGYFYLSPAIYHEPELIQLRKEMNRAFNFGFKFSKEFIDSKSNKIVNTQEKTLGVHLRNPVHYKPNENSPYGGGLPIDTHYIFDNCSEYLVRKMNDYNFEKIFVACENQAFINLLIQKLGDSVVLYHKHDRSNENIDWQDKPNIKNALNLKVETRDCFVDAYNLSLCEKFVGTVSNIAFGTIIINPNSEFEMFPLFENIYGC